MRKALVFLFFPAFLLWIGTVPGHLTGEHGRSETARIKPEQRSRSAVEQRLPESQTQFIERIKGQSVQTKLRDPFERSDLGIGLQERHSVRSRLDGLIYENDETFAIVRGKKVSPGDRILGMRVIKIQNDKVVLANQKNVRILYLF